MKRLLFVVLGSCLISGAAWAGSYTFTPVPANMYNFPHPYSFSWTIDLASKGFDPSIEAITSATVNFHQINNWKKEPNTLFVTLMDPSAAVALGVGVYGDVTNDELMCHTPDNEWTLKDRHGNWRLKPSWFASRLEVGKYSDTDGHYGSTAPYSDVPIIFGDTALITVNTYAGDSRITIGFDPDCHYYNSGVDLTIMTTKRVDHSVPEPMSLLLGVMGLASVAGFRRLRK